MLSRFSRVWLCSTPQTAAHQSPLSPGFSRQEHWSGLPFPSPVHESEKWKWSRSVVSDSVTSWTAAYQVPPSMGFSRQEYWSGVPLPSPKVCVVKAINHSSHVQMWELDHKEDWVPKKWCLWIVVLEETLESPLDSKEIRPVNPKKNPLWIFIRRTDTEAETPISWPPDVKSWLTINISDARKDWGHEEMGATEDEMVG